MESSANDNGINPGFGEKSILKDFTLNDLEIKYENKNGKIIMQWLGECTDKNPSAVLEPYLLDISQKLKELELELECEFEKLEFMNSSTVPPIIIFIQSLEENNVKSVVSYDENIDWQEASFSALATIAEFCSFVSVVGRNL